MHGPREPLVPLDTSALERARSLPVPRVIATNHGEFEHHDFWERNDVLLARAWAEFGRGDEAVYRPFDSPDWALHPAMAAAVAAVGQGGPGTSSLATLLSPVLSQPAPGVYRLPLFSAAFCEALLCEVDRLRSSGIPARRPNGMNRHGIILTDVGFGPMLQKLTARIAAPLAEELFPDWVGPEETAETYGFTVRYSALLVI